METLSATLLWVLARPEWLSVNTERNFIGIELNEEYFNIASERIKKAEEDKAGRLF